jgi:hypothetical protein
MQLEQLEDRNLLAGIDFADGFQKGCGLMSSGAALISYHWGDGFFWTLFLMGSSKILTQFTCNILVEQSASNPDKH